MDPTLKLVFIFTAIIVVVFLIIHLCILTRRKNRRDIEKAKSRIQTWLTVLGELKNVSSFLMKETLDDIRKDFASIPKHITRSRKLIEDREYGDYAKIINSIFDPTFYATYNEAFISSQIEKDSVRRLLDNVNGKTLDSMQKEAVVSDERNTLIVAGAGSGKTLTITGKVLYLHEELGIDPNEILLVTFTNKACNEMKERIQGTLGIDIKTYTFHRLGLEIITKGRKYKPSVASEELLPEVIKDYLEKEIFNDPTASSLLLDFFSYYFYLPDEKDQINNLSEYYSKIKADQLETLKDQLSIEDIAKRGSKEKITLNKERVKSYEELAIANYLFLNSVNYEYEKPYPKNTANERYSQYKPDFYLPEYDIYIEHYGINRDNKVPWLNGKMEKEYINGMKWKRETHKSDNNKYFESYSYYQKEGVLLQKLEENLIRYDVSLSPKDRKSVLKRLVEKNTHFYDEFKNLIVTFLNQCKTNGIDNLHTLDSKIDNEGYHSTRSKIFLNIVNSIMKIYNQTLMESNQIDFNDMVNEASLLIKNGNVSLKYKYIIVDEYQDISLTRYRLIDSIRKQSNSKLFVVGDDWQSIYRFAGSDVNLINEFETINEKHTDIKKLETTYRNSQELLDIAGRFVMKNKSQRIKRLSSSKTIDEPIRLVMYDDSKLKAIESAVERILKDSNEVSDILLLGRYNYDENIIENDKQINLVSHLNNKYSSTKFSFLTVHKAKGLEANHVILLNAEDSRMGFPSKISDDILLDLVLPKKEPMTYSEERRLFYVALTRTKNKVYILVPNINRIYMAE